MEAEDSGSATVEESHARAVEVVHIHRLHLLLELGQVHVLAGRLLARRLQLVELLEECHIPLALVNGLQCG